MTDPYAEQGLKDSDRRVRRLWMIYGAVVLAWAATFVFFWAIGWV